MWLVGEILDHLRSKTDPDGCSTKPALRQIFVIKPLTTTHTFAVESEGNSRNDHQLYIFGWAGGVTLRLIDAEGSRLHLLWRVVVEIHHIPLDTRQNDTLATVPFLQKLLTARLVGQRREESHHASPDKVGKRCHLLKNET